MTVFMFIATRILTRNFIFLFLSSFTIVIMMAWRASLRDEIFKAALASVGRRI